jgi:prepilin-type processing-associated H-X9-DG protein
MYTQQYGYYPCGDIYDNSKIYSIWPVRLRPFTNGSQDVFFCPAQDERCKWEKAEPLPGAPGRATEGHAAYGYEIGEPLLDADGTYFSYGYNELGASGGAPNPPDEGHLGLGQYLIYQPALNWTPAPCELRANRVRVPSDMIAITDSTADGIGDMVTHPYVHSDPRQNVVEPGAVHSGGANVLFCDGHVQWFPQKGLLVAYDVRIVAEDSIRRMWNNNNRINVGRPGE